MVDSGTLFAAAWRVVPRLPAGLARQAFEFGGVVAHGLRIRQVRQLEANLERVTGISDRRRLRRLSRRGMRSYLRYYCELFQLPGLGTSRLAARVRLVGERDIPEQANLHGVVAGVAHLGNWDLAGAWWGQHATPVITVAETLEPESLFQEFLTLRQGLGMRIIPYRKGGGVFSQLLSAARTEAALIPLLADRDLTRDGVVVQVNGHAMRVAPGPAALALSAGMPFVGGFLRYERLRGVRRRAAGSPWGVVIEFTDPITPPAGACDRATAVAAMMQAWADRLGAFLAEYPEDWHMLQKCFMADLDADRLARAPGDPAARATAAGEQD